MHKVPKVFSMEPDKLILKFIWENKHAGLGLRGLESDF